MPSYCHFANFLYRSASDQYTSLNSPCSFQLFFIRILPSFIHFCINNFETLRAQRSRLLHPSFISRIIYPDFVIFVMPANALLNPAAVYCEALGYNYTIQSTEHGERGLCQLSNGDVVDAWEFLQGKVAQNYSYCCQKVMKLRR